MLFRLTPQLRRELKAPLGELVRGEIPEPYERIRGELEGADYLITVGDIVTENVLKLGIKPDVAVYDYRTKRREYKPDIDMDAVVMTVRNPSGTITKALLNAVRKGLELARRGRRVCIKVAGEEDLAAIPAVLYAPTGSIVLYGQPGEGVVLIKVTPECRLRCGKIMSRMEVVRDGD
ncbi:GTP-dependent dephospho-CoA kinase [Thermococcus sp. P6]|uniref:GTP-dependent dephospho-CoA kinase n=1 Tax=Thermococcus sp. P6 TaxID=122420 RepID=UPI000B59A094|nr:GTP-dependent dephospho-CoA kinase [Thermococcus sp. P6]